MRKLISATISGSVVIFAVSCMAGCRHLPKDGEKYYETEDSFRVITLDETATEQIDNCLIESLSIPTAPGLTVHVNVDHFFDTSSLFFENLNDITCEGVKTVYDCLNIENYPPLTTVSHYCSYTGFVTYNVLNPSINYLEDFDLSGYESTCLVGLLSDVNKYKFSYEDRSKSNGKVLKSGTFWVYQSVSISSLSVYTL